MLDFIFREYDIRGKVGTDLNLEDVYAFGKALAVYLIEKNPLLKTVVIGMDGRTHSLDIKYRLIKSFLDSGINILDAGLCPTPVVYFALHTLNVHAGVMITASHNGPEFNGFKICLGHDTVSGKELKEVYKLFQRKEAILTAKPGTLQEYPIKERYIEWFVTHFEHLKHYPMSVIIDCGNGTAGTVLDELIHRMQWKNVKLLYTAVDGTFPNHEADPTKESNMLEVKRLLKTTSVELGIGFDGDCDRMTPMTKEGHLVPGDKLITLFALPILTKNPGCTIIYDIKGSPLIAQWLQTHGAKTLMVPSGHSIVKKAIKQNKAVLGGELSCHFCFNDRYFGYDDGIYALMRLFELLINKNTSLSQLLEQLPMTYTTPELRIDCLEKDKRNIIESAKLLFEQRTDAQLSTVDGVHVTLPYGWGLARFSNTQSAITIRCESDTPQGLDRIKQDFMEVLMPHFDQELLHAHFQLEGAA